MGGNIHMLYSLLLAEDTINARGWGHPPLLLSLHADDSRPYQLIGGCMEVDRFLPDPPPADPRKSLRAFTDAVESDPEIGTLFGRGTPEPLVGAAFAIQGRERRLFSAVDSAGGYYAIARIRATGDVHAEIATVDCVLQLPNPVPLIPHMLWHVLTSAQKASA